jgi:uncharacterized membrane protein YphA (DoxX/SURF4 family)
MALGVSPLLLRLALAVVFIWAGLGKVMSTQVLDAEQAAVLANMGVLRPTAATNPADPAPGGGPTKPLPAPENNAGPGDEGNVRTPASGPAGGVVRVSQEGGAGAPQGASPGVSPPATKTYTAADFPEPVKVKALYSLAVMIHAAAHPAARADGSVPAPLWPPALAEGRLPLIFAYLVLAAELGGGVLVLLGLCTRFAAFSIAGVMLGAMWLTQFGPAVQQKATVLGFLPQYPPFDPAWFPLMFQFVLFAMALALMFSGPGYMAADHALFGGRRRHTDHDGE